MNVNWLWAFVFLLGMLLFGFTVSTPDHPAPMTVNGLPSVILDVREYQRGVEGWTPTVEDVIAADQAAVTAARLDERGPFISGYRQYVGIVEDGERKIVINSLCKEFDNWDEQYVFVLDGGPCFWNATYNVETGEIEHLYVNGNA